MALTVGARLGVYQVTAPLGEGGMGQVWRATDTTLGRQVAIKILPDAFAADPERLARFEREAKTLASLNHPHIAAIYAVEESGGTLALVMELVEGEDLSAKIRSGTGMALDEVLSIARQIAEALEAAHELGIVHRDVKPANIKVRPDGTVKVLDFGLAKAIETGTGNREPGAEPTNSTTVTTPAMTQAGMILGTAAYMSPEQSRGKAVDKRADIWSFGCVLYEMLTGRRAFEGADAQDTLVAITRDEPDWTRVPATLPPALGVYLRRCLQKDPKQRIHDIADVRLALDGAFETVVPQPLVSSAPRQRRAWMVAAAAVVVAAALVVPALRYLRQAPPDVAVMRFTIPLPDGVTLASAPMISPDGRHVVFAGGGALFVRSLEALAAQRLPSTEGASAPFWSPDSRSVGFFADGKLKKLDIGGGLAVTICDARSGTGGSWSSKGVIVFAPNEASGLQQVLAAGGTPAPATVLDPTTRVTSHRWPQFLPDGEHVLYLSLSAQGNAVFVSPLGAPASTSLVSTNVRAEYAPNGGLLFMNGQTLMRQPLDTTGFRLLGAPAPVAEGLGLSGGDSNAPFSVSHTGVLVYATRSDLVKSRLVWVDRAGGVTPLALTPGRYSNPALSPDGQQVVFSGRDSTGSQLWIYDIARGTLDKRTFEGSNSHPIWTANGAFLTFSRGLPTGILMRVRADGTGNAEPLVTREQLAGRNIATSWSADGRLLAIHSVDTVVVRDTDGVFHPVLTNGSWSAEGRFSPDGRWLVYTGGETGRSEVYVQSYPPGGGKWQISSEGGSQAMWAPDGRELFYRHGNRMMVVDVEPGNAFKASTPRVLFEMPLSEASPGDPSRFAVTSDAQRFLVLTPAEGEKAAPPLTVVQNWAQTLQR